MACVTKVVLLAFLAAFGVATASTGTVSDVQLQKKLLEDNEQLRKENQQLRLQLSNALPVRSLLEEDDESGRKVSGRHTEGSKEAAEEHEEEKEEGEEGEKESEGEGKEEGEEEGEEEEGEGEEEEEFTAVDVGCGWMLLGSVTFTIVLFYLVNWSDDDIRRYSWSVISTTLSIFTAVLMFQGLNNLLYHWVLDPVLGSSGEFKLLSMLFGWLFFFLWYATMQLAIVSFSGAWPNASGYDPLNATDVWVIADGMRADFGEKVADEDVRTKTGVKSIAVREGLEVFVHKKSLEKEKRDRRTKCWATLFAHMAGFAAISAGGDLQHFGALEESPALSFLAVAVSAIVMLMLHQVMTLLRPKEMAGVSKWQAECLELCGEQAEEAENDVFSLCVSYLLVQSIRFSLTGVLPEKLGLEHPAIKPGPESILGLFGFGILFAVVTAVAAIYFRHGRVSELVQGTCSTSFAWCFLWATRWVALEIEILDKLSAGPETMEGRIILALFLSAAAFLVIFVLDVIEDSGGDNAQMSRIIQNIITALSILVGFTWEQCFDGGLEAVSSKSRHPMVTQVCFTAMVAVIVIPAWRRHILVKVLQLQEFKQARKLAKNAEMSHRGLLASELGSDA